MVLEDKLKENAELGAKILKEYLKGERSGSDKIKYASNAITQLLKHEATKGVTDTIKLTIGKAMAANKEELKAFIDHAMPEYSTTRAIGPKKPIVVP